MPPELPPSFTERLGEAVGTVLQLGQLQRFPIPDFLMTPLASHVMSYVTLAVELGFPFLIWIPRLRVPVLLVDLSEDEEHIVLASVDPVALMAGTDLEKHRELINEVETENEALAEPSESASRPRARARTMTSSSAAASGADAARLRISRRSGVTLRRTTRTLGSVASTRPDRVAVTA
jgi:hypothetical protein